MYDKLGVFATGKSERQFCTVTDQKDFNVMRDSAVRQFGEEAEEC
jgi:hypothetical protein